MIRRVDFRFEFKKFKKKSKQLVLMYTSKNFCSHYKGIVADGAVRSSKTFSLSLGQVIYVNQTQSGTLNLWGGVSKEAVDRNYVTPLINVLESIGFTCNRSGNEVEIYLKRATKQTKRLGLRVGARNYYEIKGGDTVRSESKIQGATYYTVMIDEAPKCDRQYIRQSMARTISYGIDGKVFFTGNPEGSKKHWFYKEYIERGFKKKLFRLHFKLEDNGSLTEEQIKLAKTQYEGVFYRRMIEGEWVAAEGLIYDCVSKENYITPDQLPGGSLDVYLSLDYGNSNAFSCGLWIKKRGENIAYRADQYYYNAKKAGKKKSAALYVKEITQMIERYGLEPWEIESVIVDPSAPIKVELEEGGFYVVDADNSVREGIEETYKALAEKEFL